jgi:hypothetical protein
MARYLAGAAGRAALERALPLYLATGIIAVILFAGNGLDAKTVTDQARASRAFRSVLLGAWVMVTLPAARAWLTTPATFFLRALPLPRGGVTFVLGLGCCLIQVPWAVLWLRGDGALGGLCATLAALAIQVSWIAGYRRLLDVAPLLVAVAWLASPSWLSVMAYAAAFAWGLREAWRRAPEPAAGGRHCVVSGPPWLALSSAVLAATFRGHRPVFLRALVLTLGASVLPVIYLERNAGELTATVLIFWQPACIFGAMSISGPVLRVERSFDWVIRASGARAGMTWAPGALLASGGAVAGAMVASVVVIARQLGAVEGSRLMLECALAGAAWALSCVGLAQRMTRSDGLDAGRLVLACVASCALSTWLLIAHPSVAVVGIMAAAGLIIGWPRRPPRALA